MGPAPVLSVRWNVRGIGQAMIEGTGGGEKPGCLVL